MTEKKACIANRKGYLSSVRDLEEVLRLVEFYEDHYDADDFKKQLLEKMSFYQKKAYEMPIGYKYVGAYYKWNKDLKEYEKFEGELFMREDLISWMDSDPNASGYYMRNLYKEPDGTKPLLREHGTPIFDTK